MEGRIIEQIKVLIVDDQELFREIIKQMLVNEPTIKVIAEASNGNEAIELYEQKKPDVVLMDIFMPDYDGLQATSQITTNYNNAKVLMLTTSNNIDDLNEAIEKGSIGFIKKSVSKENLILAIRAAFLNIEIIQKDIHVKQTRDDYDIRRVNQQLLLEKQELEKRATTDQLTGIWNRRYIEDQIEAIRYNTNTQKSLLLIDIDHFKDVNDNYGHNVGDQVLVELTTLIKSKIRSTDSFARWGGEEFVIIADISDETNIAQIAEKLRISVNQHVFAVANHITISIGAANKVFGESLEEWVKRADEALYRAKSNGRNNVVVLGFN